jgi:hypothetical protein
VPNSSADMASATRTFLPILAWLPAYRREWLLADVLAGVALWAVMVPEGMAYAGIIGVPPIMGLYTIVPGVTRLCAARHVASARRRTGHRYWSDLCTDRRRHRHSGYRGL